MATIVNTPAPAQQDSGSGIILAVALVIIFILAALYFGGGMLRNTVTQPTNQINVPDKINVDVNTNPKK
jgi:hypothetical protein